MATATELVVAEELATLRELASHKGWSLQEISTTRFLLGLPARDGNWFYLLVDCDQYKAMPPSWCWSNADGSILEAPTDTPMGSGYLHSHGVICAPWNRLAYSTQGPRGPHSDWQIGDWTRNSYTKGCTTLAAMALRIAVELRGPRYQGPKAKRAAIVA